MKKISLTQRRNGATKSKKKKTMTENEIAKQIMDAAFLIHLTLGPGLLETVYEVILARS